MKNSSLPALALLLLAFTSASALVIPDPLPPAPQPIDDILRVQIFLDTQLFGPGKLDGRPGEFTSKALKRYQRAQGLPETELADHTLDLASVPEVYTTYTIREEDLNSSAPCRASPPRRAKRNTCPTTRCWSF
jgi:peptidoglycan hydrolase-like protein with peptidoglycan-binding domain